MARTIESSRPTKIHIQKIRASYIIDCIDELTGSCTSIHIPENGYKALAEHFRTGKMEVSSDDVFKNSLNNSTI